MALGPHFSANKLQAVLKSATGAGSATVRGALLHIGAQKTLQTGASVKDAKALIQKLRTSGAIKDEWHARAVFRSAERVANAADRMRIKETKEERLKVFDSSRKPQSLAQSIVDAHQHGTSIVGDKNVSQHYNSVAEALKHPVMSKPNTGLSGGIPAARPLLDIQID